MKVIKIKFFLMQVGIQILFFNFLLCDSVFGQYSEPTEKSIYLGDRVPEAFYNIEHEAVHMQTLQRTKIRLSDYKDKLIILDYWATWCGPCIYSLGKLDSITRTIENKDFIVIPITYQTVSELERRKSLFNTLNFTSIIMDSITSEYFPHRTLPYMVWIKDGKVLAFPKWDYATVENINKAVKGDSIKVVTIHQARMVDPNKPMFEENNGESYHRNSYGNLKIVGHTPGYASYFKHYKDSTKQVLFASNYPLPLLLQSFFYKDVFPKYTFSDIIWNVNESHKGLYKPLVPSVVADQRQDSLYQDWMEKYTFGFAVEASLDAPLDSLYAVLKDGMKVYMKERFRIDISVEKRKKERYAELRTIGSPEIVKQLLTQPSDRKTGIYNEVNVKTYVGRSFGDQFVNVLNGIVSRSKKELNLTVADVLDKTDIEPSTLSNFSIDHSLFNGGSLTDINRMLKRYGMVLVVREEYVPALVVSNLK